jgi:hypothetical protein
MGCIKSKPVDQNPKIIERLTEIESHLNIIDRHVQVIEEYVYYIQKNMKRKHRSHRYIDNDVTA